MWQDQEEVGVELPNNRDSSLLGVQALVVGKEEAVIMGRECHFSRR
jgi:hypothetical protein